MRPMVSASRSALVRRAATATSSRSPASWPSVSLTFLKSSRSTNSAAPVVPFAAVRASSCSMRSTISARLGRSVSASCSAWWRSSPVCRSTNRHARARPVPSTTTRTPSSRLRRRRQQGERASLGDAAGRDVAERLHGPPVVQIDRGRLGVRRRVAAGELHVRFAAGSAASPPCPGGPATRARAPPRGRAVWRPGPRSSPGARPSTERPTGVDGGSDRHPDRPPEGYGTNEPPACIPRRYHDELDHRSPRSSRRCPVSRPTALGMATAAEDEAVERPLPGGSTVQLPVGQQPRRGRPPPAPRTPAGRRPRRPSAPRDRPSRGSVRRSAPRWTIARIRSATGSDPTAAHPRRRPGRHRAGTRKAATVGCASGTHPHEPLPTLNRNRRREHGGQCSDRRGGHSCTVPHIRGPHWVIGMWAAATMTPRPGTGPPGLAARAR